MPKESLADKQKRARVIVARLKKIYPDAKCSLDYQNPLQLLVATVLSAQCTDARVNMVTPNLFKRYPTAQALAEADITELETIIRSTGFYKNKAKNIKAAATKIVQEHQGQVPRTMEELSHLPGVGRKTANVVLGNAFDVPGMTVDTHVTRLSNRLGLAKGKDAVKLEFQLMDVVEKKDWTIFSHLLIHHGRAVCVARSPRCLECQFVNLCPKVGVSIGKNR